MSEIALVIRQNETARNATQHTGPERQRKR